VRGGGKLLDLEYLTETPGGRRVAAFGYHAGFAGAALALKAWSWQQVHRGNSENKELPPLPAVTPYASEEALVQEISKDLEQAFIRRKSLSSDGDEIAKLPTALVVGALGRCGSGAINLLERVGFLSSSIAKWDINETKAGGPFPEILNFNVFINCIFLAGSIPPFMTLEMLREKDSNLSVIADVSCDAMSPFNPIPVYNIYTTFKEPTVRVELGDVGREKKVLDVISIDHLPSMVPREASEAFSKGVLPNLLQLKNWKEDPAWKDVEKKFFDAVLQIL
jgi:saccharopine dehydrogenase (NAD+, L-lysine-forming)